MPRPLFTFLDRSATHLTAWMLLLAGMTMIALTLLIPATLENRQLAWQRDYLAAQARAMAQQENKYRQFIAAIDQKDPVLLERLAFCYLRMKPANSEWLRPRQVIVAAGRNPGVYLDRPPGFADANVEAWLHTPLPRVGKDFPPLTPIKSTLVLLTTTPLRLVLIAAASVCLFLALRVPTPSLARPDPFIDADERDDAEIVDNFADTDAEADTDTDTDADVDAEANAESPDDETAESESETQIKVAEIPLAMLDDVDEAPAAALAASPAPLAPTLAPTLASPPAAPLIISAPDPQPAPAPAPQPPAAAPITAGPALPPASQPVPAPSRETPHPHAGLRAIDASHHAISAHASADLLPDPHHAPHHSESLFDPRA